MFLLELAPIPALPPIHTPTPTTAILLPVLAINWERIKKFKSILQAEYMETYSRYKER